LILELKNLDQLNAQRYVDWQKASRQVKEADQLLLLVRGFNLCGLFGFGATKISSSTLIKSGTFLLVRFFSPLLLSSVGRHKPFNWSFV